MLYGITPYGGICNELYIRGDHKDVIPWIELLYCIEWSNQCSSLASGFHSEESIMVGLLSSMFLCNLRLKFAVLCWWSFQSYVHVNIAYSILSFPECCHCLWFSLPSLLGLLPCNYHITPLRHAHYNTASLWYGRLEEIQYLALPRVCTHWFYLYE